MKRWFSALAAALVLLCLVGCASPVTGEESSVPVQSAAALLTREEQTPPTPTDPASEPAQSLAPTPESAEIPAQDPAQGEQQPNAPPAEEQETLPEDGSYTTRDDVALYIHLYGHLPGNFITKKQAEALGWSGGSLEPYAPGKCIGGSRFGNYEGLLPEKEGRTYTECDIDTLGAKSRGAKRIVFSNDGLVFYTDDHYESFMLLYGEETP